MHNWSWIRKLEWMSVDSCVLTAEASHASFSAWISNEYERSHASFHINTEWISCHSLWFAVLFFEQQISWDIQKFCLTHSKQFAEIADSVQVTVLTNLILQHEFNNTVKKIFLILLIEFQLVVSLLDQIFNYLFIMLVAVKMTVKKLLNVEWLSFIIYITIFFYKWQMIIIQLIVEVFFWWNRFEIDDWHHWMNLHVCWKFQFIC